MAWFFILPLSLLTGPAGLVVALACFFASRQKGTPHKVRTSPLTEAEIDQMLFDECKRQPLSIQTMAFMDKCLDKYGK